MALSFYLDAALTMPLNYATLKQFIFPLDGGTRTTSLWLGDATPGTYYSAGISNIKIYVFGGGSNPPNPTILVELKTAGSDTYGLPSVPLILPASSIYGGIAGAIEVGIQVTIPAGPQRELLGVQINSIPMTDQNGDVVSATAGFDIIQIQDGLPVRMHLLPTSRQVSAELPGFNWGTYRWRDESTVNEIPLIPQHWDPNIAAIGENKFIYGIGCNDDLELVDIEQASDSNSIYPRIGNGAFWDYTTRYWFPASGYGLEFLPVSNANASASWQPTFILQQTPAEISPIFVGVWAADDLGFYDTQLQYRYMCNGFNTTNCPPYNPYQFTLNRATNTLTLNQGLPNGQLLIGLTSGNTVDYFDLPVHPITRITDVWVNNPITNINIHAIYSFNQADGTITVNSAINQDGSPVQGLSVWAAYEPAIAVLYEVGDTDNILIDDGSVELNPAFSGVAKGYLYLQTRKYRPGSIQLIADKPVIPTSESLVPSGMEVYGPVQYSNDYALLTATVYGYSPWALTSIPPTNPSGLTGGPVIQTNEMVPGVEMQVIPGPEWFGLINYQDPSVEQVFVTSGGDGQANMIYLPNLDIGQYMPLSDVANNVLTLSEPIPFSDIYDEQGWTISTYEVWNNNPYLGTTSTPTVYRGRRGTGNNCSIISQNPWSYNGGALSAHFWFKPSAAPQTMQPDNSFAYGVAGTDGEPTMQFRWNSSATSDPTGSAPVALVATGSSKVMAPYSGRLGDGSTGCVAGNGTIAYNGGPLSIHFWFKPISGPTYDNPDNVFAFGLWNASASSSNLTTLGFFYGTNLSEMFCDANDISPVFYAMSQHAGYWQGITQGLALSGWPIINEWNSIAITSMDGNTFSYYLNGNLLSTAYVYYPTAQNAQPWALRIGPNSSGYSTHAVADCAVWTCALTSGDIINLVGGAAATTIEEANLACYWGFSGDNPESDLSGNGITGTVTDTQIIPIVNPASFVLPVPKSAWPSAGSWTPVAMVTPDGQNFSVYIDGVNVASGEMSYSTYVRQTNFTGLAGTSNSGFSSDAIADPAAWNMALTSGDIGSLTSGGCASTVEYAHLKDYWMFQGINPELDYSGNNNNGIVVSTTPIAGPGALTTFPASYVAPPPSIPTSPNETGYPEYSLGTGYRVLWQMQGSGVNPLYAIDDKGNPSTSPAFDGTVAKLVYPYDLPNDSYIAAFYISYIQTVSLMLQAVGSNVKSNVIYIQMGTPPVFNENPFLIIQDKVQGRLNLYRLGGAWPTAPSVTNAP